MSRPYYTIEECVSEIQAIIKPLSFIDKTYSSEDLVKTVANAIHDLDRVIDRVDMSQ